MTAEARESVKAQVEAFREFLAGDPPIQSLVQDLRIAMFELAQLGPDSDDYEAIELWARLAADLAGMLGQRDKPTCRDCGGSLSVSCSCEPK